MEKTWKNHLERDFPKILTTSSKGTILKLAPLIKILPDSRLTSTLRISSSRGRKRVREGRGGPAIIVKGSLNTVLLSLRQFIEDFSFPLYMLLI